MKYARSLGCNVTQETNSKCHYVNVCYHLDPFINQEIQIESASARNNEWQCQIECQKVQKCDFWTLYWMEGYNFVKIQYLCLLLQCLFFSDLSNVCSMNFHIQFYQMKWLSRKLHAHMLAFQAISFVVRIRDISSYHWVKDSSLWIRFFEFKTRSQ